MKKNILLCLFFVMQMAYAFSATYYVAVDGKDTNPGTLKMPLATIQKAQSLVSPGDTVYLRGGVYHMSEDHISQRLRGYACVTYLDKSGAEGKYINYFAYTKDKDKPVFEYSAVKPAGLRVAAFYVTG